MGEAEKAQEKAFWYKAKGVEEVCTVLYRRRSSVKKLGQGQRRGQKDSAHCFSCEILWLRWIRCGDNAGCQTLLAEPQIIVVCVWNQIYLSSCIQPNGLCQLLVSSTFRNFSNLSPNGISPQMRAGFCCQGGATHSPSSRFPLKLLWLGFVRQAANCCCRALLRRPTPAKYEYRLLNQIFRRFSCTKKNGNPKTDIIQIIMILRTREN